MKDFIEINKGRFIKELIEFLSIPSISANGTYKSFILKTASFLENALQEAGMNNTHIYSTAGNPIVYAEKNISTKLPTVLIYGHYDVQPADPIDLWETPPFEPSIRNGKIYARGACDDKSQVYLVIKAIETLNAFGNFPCNIKVIFEGEEETGSESLKSFVAEQKELLKSDVLLICDTSMPEEDKPSLITSLRGICYCEIEVSGAPKDLHSGMFGGAVVNPLQVLCDLMSKLKDENNTILIPGFYDNIEIQEKNTAHFPVELNDFIVTETGFNAEDSISIRPSLDIHGIHGGYTEEGPKTVISSKAKAKLSMRLALGQDHTVIAKQLHNYLLDLMPKQAKLSFNKSTGCNALRTDTHSAAYKAAYTSLTKQFSVPPINLAIGGTIPIVSIFKDELNIEPLLMGFGLDSDNIHSPNECFLLRNFFKGIYTLIDFFQEYQKQYALEHKTNLSLI